MNRWCKNLILVTALAVVGTGCAQSRGIVAQSAAPGVTTSSGPPKAVGAADKIQGTGDRENPVAAADSPGRSQIVQTAFQESPRDEPRPDKPENPEPESTESEAP